MLWGCSDIIVIIFWLLFPDALWNMTIRIWNLKSFYLTSSELVILQLLGKSTVACITIIAVYPESLCLIFILPVWNRTRTLTTKWILLRYSRKSCHWKHITGKRIRHQEKWIEYLYSQLCCWSHEQPEANHLNPFPSASLLWNENIIFYYSCHRLGAIGAFILPNELTISSLLWWG